MKTFFLLTLTVLLSAPALATDLGCTFNAAVNPFHKFAGRYKVLSYRRLCTGGTECNSPAALKLSLLANESTPDATLNIVYDSGTRLNLRLRNQEFDNEDMSYTMCGNEELARMWFITKFEEIETRILMIRQFHGLILLFDDGGFSESMVLGKDEL